jgi:hypothetical protein
MMTADDLKAAQELFRRRKMVADAWEVARSGAGKGITEDVILTFKVKERDRTGAVVEANKHVRLAKEDDAEMCKLALAVLAERLKDIDASLRAFGCSPPKGTDAAMAKLRP